jgi:hypothetical protein
LSASATRRAHAVAASLALACAAQITATAHAAQIYKYDAGAPASRKALPRHSSPPRAPSAPPLVAGGAPTGTGTGGALGGATGLGIAGLEGADASSSAPASGGDPLVGNGLGSPLCGAGASELSVESRRNCTTSGFEAAGAPTGDYALDVHIDTGALGFTVATLEQDYLIGPVWMGLVWVVHTLVVALEWCFTLDLLGGSAMGSIERSLRGAQAGFTQPWLVLALALAAVTAAYNGLVRRRVAETLGQAALMLAMMVAGLWVIADPTGTVGALGRWVDTASVGTLGSVVEGSPAQASRTLADSMDGLFAGVVGAPWCYLEFGDVRWCTEPALLDRRLRSAGLRIAAAARSGGCASGSFPEAGCQALEGEQPPARAQSATLLAAARTNGELFLALPADEAARNSINDSASLLHVLCGGSTDATDCRGPTASQAEFRTQGGTAPRVGGLLLIALGALGMMLLLGYIALHLLGSELIGLVYLLLAPVAVLAPALGDGGRTAFRAWAARLIGAVTSKLVFSFLLGVVLLLTRTLLGLYGLGWWTRWLLVSSMWWGAYFQRRRVLGFMQGDRSHIGQRTSADRAAHSGHGGAHGQLGHHDSIARRVQRQLESPLAAVRAAQWVRGRLAKPAPSVDRRHALERAAPQRARAKAGRQATRMLEREHEQALADIAEAPRIQAEMGARREQLTRVQAARATAADAGDARRAATLQVRARRIEGEIDRAQKRLRAARRTVAAGERSRRTTGRPYTRAEVAERGRFLDAQAALPAGGRRGSTAGEAGSAGGRAELRRQRDYAALASLAGYGREQYERLDPRHRRDTRLQIDRELAPRSELSAAARDRLAVPAPAPAPAGAGAGDPLLLGHRERPQARRGFDPALERRLREGGHAPPNSPAAPAVRESTVMRDAREVARRRKRQLGLDR